MFFNHDQAILQHPKQYQLTLCGPQETKQG